jgi:hypothetical protein
LGEYHPRITQPTSSPNPFNPNYTRDTSPHSFPIETTTALIPSHNPYTHTPHPKNTPRPHKTYRTWSHAFTTTEHHHYPSPVDKHTTTPPFAKLEQHGLHTLNKPKPTPQLQVIRNPQNKTKNTQIRKTNPITPKHHPKTKGNTPIGGDKCFSTRHINRPPQFQLETLQDWTLSTPNPRPPSKTLKMNQKQKGAEANSGKTFFNINPPIFHQSHKFPRVLYAVPYPTPKPIIATS